MKPALLFDEVARDVRGADTRPRSHNKHLDAAVRWLFEAQDATGTGGCATAYNLVLGWGDPYPETTGYIIPTLYDYADEADKAGEMDDTLARGARTRAEQMARWLLGVQLDSGAFPGGTDTGPEPEPSVFNTGQILFGLRRAHRETGDEAFRDALRRGAEWLVDVQHERGYWDRHDYNDAVHVYSSRVAWALMEAYEETGTEAFREAAAANLRWVVGCRRDNGWFEHAGFDAGEDPFLHTIAYTVRGLLEGGLRLNDDALVDSARASADSLLELHNLTGILRGQYDEEFQSPDFYCLTGNAQMAIVWYRLYEETGDDDYRRTADDTVAFLQTKQRLDGPPEVRGGLKGSSPVWQRYMYLRYPNWAAKFLADALLLARRHGDD